MNGQISMSTSGSVSIFSKRQLKSHSLKTNTYKCNHNKDTSAQEG